MRKVWPVEVFIDSEGRVVIQQEDLCRGGDNFVVLSVHQIPLLIKFLREGVREIGTPDE
jgi:hypothetical protein